MGDAGNGAGEAVAGDAEGAGLGEVEVGEVGADVVGVALDDNFLDLVAVFVLAEDADVDGKKAGEEGLAFGLELGAVEFEEEVGFELDGAGGIDLGLDVVGGELGLELGDELGFDADTSLNFFLEGSVFGLDGAQVLLFDQELAAGFLEAPEEDQEQEDEHQEEAGEHVGIGHPVAGVVGLGTAAGRLRHWEWPRSRPEPGARCRPAS